MPRVIFHDFKVPEYMFCFVFENKKTKKFSSKNVEHNKWSESTKNAKVTSFKRVISNDNLSIHLLI